MYRKPANIAKNSSHHVAKVPDSPQRPCLLVVDFGCCMGHAYISIIITKSLLLLSSLHFVVISIIYMRLFVLSPEACGCFPIAVAQGMRKQMSQCCVEADMGVSLQVLSIQWLCQPIVACWLRQGRTAQSSCSRLPAPLSMSLWASSGLPSLPAAWLGALTLPSC